MLRSVVHEGHQYRQRDYPQNRQHSVRRSDHHAKRHGRWSPPPQSARFADHTVWTLGLRHAYSLFGSIARDPAAIRRTYKLLINPAPALCAKRNDVVPPLSLLGSKRDTTIVAPNAAAASSQLNCRIEYLEEAMQNTNSGISTSWLASFAPLLVGATCAVLAPHLGFAQETMTSSGTLAEVLVTAQKQGTESVQQTPIAVQAFSGAQLQTMGAVSINDWARYVPGLALQDNGPGDERYVIRGVNSAGSGTVGVYLDDVVITGENSQNGGGQAPDIMLFDMDRIEVLKGPQGTTFGSSSMTGTIRFITARPNLNEMIGSFGASYIQTRGGGVGNQIDGMINLPLISHRLAIRLAGFNLDEPGYIDTPFANNANATHVKAGRASLKFAITDRLTLNAMAMTQSTTDGALPYYNPVTVNGTPTPEPGLYQNLYACETDSNNMNMYDLALKYHASFGTFTVTSSRFDRNLLYSRDASLTLQKLLKLPADTTGRSVIGYPKSRVVSSDEVRFASHWQGPLQILLGGFFQNEQRDFESHVLSALPTGFVPLDPTVYLDRTQNDTIREKSAFAQVSWAFNDQWKLSLGGRHYDISDYQVSDAIVNFGGRLGGGPGPALEATNVGQIGKIDLSYTPTKNVLAYALISQGFRPGGANDQTAAAIAGVSIPASFSSDSLVNYEMGLKTSWLDRHVIANGDVYFINWSQIQLQEQATKGGASFPYTGNSGRATVKGIELELHALPMTGLELSAYFNYNDAVLVADIPYPSLGLVGDHIPYVPLTTGTLDADYEWPLGVRDLRGTVGADYTHQSSSVSQLLTQPVNPLFETFPGYGTADVRVGVKADSWSALINVQNVFNDRSTINDIRVNAFYPPAPVPNRPRTISVVFRAYF